MSKHKFVKRIKDGFRPDISFIENQQIKMFFQRCWSSDPTERPEIKEISKLINLEIFQKVFQMDSNEFCQYIYWFYNNLRNKNDVSFKNMYASRLLFGIGIPQNEEKGLKILKECVDQGNVDSYYMYATWLSKSKNQSDIQQSNYYYKKAADLGNVDAMIDYGNQLLNGNGIEVDFTEAAKYYKKAADLGNAEAMFNYAHMLHLGKGVKADLKKAVQYYQNSADLGNVNAMFQFASMSEKGEGIPMDCQQAVKYYKKAIFSGDEESMYNLGVLLSEGEIEMNLIEAEKYLEMAAKSGKREHLFAYSQILSQIALTTDCNENEMINYLKKSKKFFKKTKVQYGSEKSESFYNLLDSLLKESCRKKFKSFKEYKNYCLRQYTNVFYGRSSQTNYSTNFDILDAIFGSLLNDNDISSDYDDDDNDDKITIIDSDTTKKTINDVKVNIYLSMDISKNVDDSCCIYFLESSFPQHISEEIDANLKNSPGFRKKIINRCISNDPNYMFNFYIYSDMEYVFMAFKTFLKIIDSNNYEKFFPPKSTSLSIYKSIESIEKLEKNESNPIDLIFDYIKFKRQNKISMMMEKDLYNATTPIEYPPEFLFFDETMIPPKVLPNLIQYLSELNEIIEIKRNVFDGKQILTYIFVKNDKQKEVIQSIRNFLSTSEILFQTHNYPLQTVIMINEDLILKEKGDFEIILKEIESIGIKPINVERNKLYSYNFYNEKKLFQKFSFICFKMSMIK